MKISRISCVVILFLFCSLQSRSNPIVNNILQSEYDIEQSPLADDETNPISAITTDIAEFDFEDNDENNFSSTHLKLVSFVKSTINFESFVSRGIANAYNHQLRFSLHHSEQSYLQVFRI